MRRPLFGPAGPWLVRVLCVYEFAALLPGSPLPPLTHLNRKHPWVGGLLLAAGFHHLYVEQVVLPMGGTNGPVR